MGRETSLSLTREQGISLMASGWMGWVGGKTQQLVDHIGLVCMCVCVYKCVYYKYIYLYKLKPTFSSVC